jgi:hypothetical protein
MTVSLALAELPSLSLTEQLMLWVPSLDTLAVQLPAVLPAVSVRGLAVLLMVSVQMGPPATKPEPVSLAETLRVTGEVLFQPKSFAPVWLTEMVGGVVSFRV